jgi:hypothetical protein
MIYYVLMALVSGLYAGLLATKEGRRVAKDRTAETVIVGTSLVLAVARLGGMPWRWWTMLTGLFAAAGLPMYLRSWWLRVKTRR